MRVCVRLAALATLLALATPAQGSVPQPSLDKVASGISGQQLEVRCWAEGVDDPDQLSSAWGYVYLFGPVVYLSPDACAGALALVNRSMAPLWQQALGALVLTHEAYHLKDSLPFERRASEKQTECRAIKRVRETMVELGATQALADVLLPWAIAMHYRIALVSRDYWYPSCAVPVFKSFWP